MPFRTLSWPKLEICAAAAAFVVLIVAAGCYTSHVRRPYVEAGDVKLPLQSGSDLSFSCQRSPIPFTNHVLGTGATSLYEHRFLEIPSVGDNNQPGNLVTASYYRSIIPGTHPMVIVLPIWGTYTYPSRKMSAFIQKHADGEVHVLHVHGEHYLLDWEGLAEAPDAQSLLEVFRQAMEYQRVTMIDVRRLVDWAEQRPEIDGDRVALVGFSFSATIAGAILTQEPRFAAAVLVMGGAEQHKILAHCAGERLTAVREKVARDFGWSADDLEALLEPIMREVDAASFPEMVDPQKVLIVEASRDDCMNEESRRALWETLGRPERITMNYDHRRAFYSLTPLGLNWMRYRIWEFLQPRLLDEVELHGPLHARR
jgi:dienelactone hydrolase